MTSTLNAALIPLGIYFFNANTDLRANEFRAYALQSDVTPPTVVFQLGGR